MRDAWDIFVRIWEMTSLQYDRWKKRCWSSPDRGLLCKSIFSLCFANNTPLVKLMYILFMYFMSDSCKLLLFTFTWIAVDLATMFLEGVYLSSTSLYWRTFYGWVDDSSRLWLWFRSMNGFLKYWTMSASKYNLLWSDITIEQNGSIPYLVMNLCMILVQNRKSILSNPLAYVFGSSLVPCLVEIGSIILHCLYSLAISPALLVKGSLVSVPMIISWCNLVSLLDVLPSTIGCFPFLTFRESLSIIVLLLYLFW